jgi:heptose-I-phosphate ethanolaminephosphotransferase
MSDSTKVATMKSNKQKPFVSDDIFHTILDLNMIESPLLEKSRSLFNVEFNDKRIRVLSDGKDYDKKIRKN